MSLPIRKIIKLEYFYFIMVQLIENKQISKIIEKAKKDEEVLAVALFGSYLTKKDYNDIDVCLFLDKKYSNLKLSNKKIDYAKEVNENIDVQIFQQLPMYIRMRILKEGKIIFVKDMPSLYDLAFLTIKEYNLYEKYYENYLSKMKNG